MDKRRYSFEGFDEKILSKKKHGKNYLSISGSEDTATLLGYHRKKNRSVNVCTFFDTNLFTDFNRQVYDE